MPCGRSVGVEKDGDWHGKGASQQGRQATALPLLSQRHNVTVSMARKVLGCNRRAVRAGESFVAICEEPSGASVRVSGSSSVVAASTFLSTGQLRAALGLETRVLHGKHKHPIASWTR